MKREDIYIIVGVAVVAAIFSLILTNLIFGGPKKRGEKVPVSRAITATFPDIKNDPAYSTFLNTNALDPAQPIPVGKSQNNQPFNGPAQ
jgi:hypothetical protein